MADDTPVEVPVTDDPPMPDLESIERALRPLRRLVARGSSARAVDPGAFVRACRRLADPLRALPVPPALKEDVDAVLGALDGEPSAEVDPLGSAWHAMVRLDERLGLPLRLPRPRRTGVSLVPLDPEPSADDSASGGEASSAEAEDGTSGKGRRKSKGRRRRRTKGGDRSTEGGAGRSSRGSSKGSSRQASPKAVAVEPVAARRWEDTPEDAGLVPGLAEACVRSGYPDVASLLLHDAAVEETRAIHGAGRSLPEGPVALGGRARGRWTRLSPDGTRQSMLRVVGAGPVDVALDPSRPVLPSHPRPGDRLIVMAASDAEGTLTQGRVVRGDHGRAIALRFADDPSDDTLVSEAVRQLVASGQVPDDPIPSALRERARVAGLADTVTRREASGPTDPTVLRRARFDAWLSLHLGRSFRRFDPGSAVRGMPHTIGHGALVRLEQDGLLGQPTAPVAAALERIKRDLRDTRPMRRVVVGDDPVPIDDLVLRTMLVVADSRAQVVVVGPDAPTVQVLHDRMAPWLDGAGIPSALLASEPDPRDLDRLRKGDLLVAFGGTGTLEAIPELRRLGLVVAYEQTEHGVIGAATLAPRRPSPDLLVVCRGQVDGKTLCAAHPTADVERFRVQATAPRATRWTDDVREEAYRSLAQDVGEGFAGVVAFPLRRGGSDLMGRREAEELAQRLGRQVFGSADLGVLHGAMTRQERARTWDRLSRGELPGVVATVPVELMPPPSRPTAILVEHADRMDLARVLALRTLASDRGRMHLVAGVSPEPGADAALNAMVDRAGDLDVIAANPGALTVAEGLGEPSCDAMADADTALVDLARETAHAILRADPALTSPRNVHLVRWASRCWSQAVQDADQPCPLPRVRSTGGGGRRRRRRRRR